MASIDPMVVASLRGAAYLAYAKEVFLTTQKDSAIANGGRSVAVLAKRIRRLNLQVSTGTHNFRDPVVG